MLLATHRHKKSAEFFTTPHPTNKSKYSYKTNTRIRIDFRNNNLYYFIAGASDNWREIEDVPNEMKYVVYSLLYKNYMVDDGEAIS